MSDFGMLRFASQFPEEYIFNWKEQTGYDAPWQIEQHALAGREFFNAFALGAIEKMCQGGFSGVPQIVREDTFSLLEDEIFADNNNKEFIKQTINFYVEMWNDGDWLKHELYNEDLTASYWDDIKDESLYTDEDLISYIGQEIFDTIFEEDEPPKLIDLLSGELWKGVGIMFWMMRYRVIAGSGRPSRFNQVNINAERFNPERLEIPPVHSFRDDNLPVNVLGIRFRATENFTAVIEEEIEETEEEEAVPEVTMDFTKDSIYEWTDVTDYETRVIGEPLTYVWIETPPVDGMQHAQSTQYYKYIDAEWVRLIFEYAAQVSSFGQVRFSANGSYLGQKSFRDEFPSFGPQSLAASRGLASTDLENSIDDDFSSNNRFNSYSWGSSAESETFNDGGTIKKSRNKWDVNVSTMHEAGVAMYNTDITGVPILGHCIFGMEIVSNIYNTDTFNSSGGPDSSLNSKLLEAYPFVSQRSSHNAPTILQQFDKTIFLDATGWTKALPIVEDLIDLIARFDSEELPDDPAFDFSDPIQIINTASYTFETQLARATPDRASIVPPVIFQDTMRPESKYYSEAAAPEPLED